MHCRCGYQFAGLTAKAKPKPKPKSYAVIRDKDYRKFLKSEVRVLNAQDEPAWMDAIARSSKYVGSALVCPLCNRLLLVPPGGGPSVSYQPESPLDRAQ
jgi:hypothetical protein